MKRSTVSSSDMLSFSEEGGLKVRPISPSSMIGGLYRVVRCLGLGRTGVVYLCEVLEDGADSSLPLVAVKLLARSIAEERERNPLFVRFQREVDAIFRVASPHVVSAYQFIHHDGLFGYSMDYVSGGNLAQALAHRGSFEESPAMSMLDSLSQGLEAIHSAGVIHRDIKPENILLTPEFQPKISDFGVSYCGLDSRLTVNGALVGTIQYLSPEYLEKGVISKQGDVYALGVLAYEIMTGEAPFVGLGLYEALEAKVTREAPDPREKCSAVSAGLAEIIQRALSPRLEKRYRSAAEFNQAIRLLTTRRASARSGGSGTRPRGSTVNGADSLALGGASAFTEEQTEGWGRRHILPRIPLMVLMLVVVAIVLQWRSANAPLAPSALSFDAMARPPESYSITRAVSEKILKRFNEEEDVYD